MKMFNSAAIVFIIMLQSLLFSQFSGGSGTSLDPYQIKTAADLDSVRYFADANFILMNDIDLSVYLSEGNPGYHDGKFWGQIGHSGNPWIGVFDGNNNVISNIKIDWESNYYLGLFGYISSSTVKNLKIITDNVTGIIGNGYIGGLAGISYNSNISGCSFSGLISGYSQTGGLVGWSSQSTISNCMANCTISGFIDTGGLIGENFNSVISNCYSTGTVSGLSDNTGGLIGTNSGQVDNCYSMCDVNGHNYTGGLFGRNTSIVTKCYSAGFVSGGSFLGGLSGYNTGSFIDSYWDTETSFQTISAGGEGKTTDEMMLQPTYFDWDFSTPIWVMNHFNKGYPHFKWDPDFIFSEGDGSPGNPYQISSADELNSVRYYLFQNFILMNDIDLSTYLSEGNPGYNDGKFWEPIGNDSLKFTGSFNGNNFKIINLKINRIDAYDVGFFGYTDGSIIKDLKIEVDPTSKIFGKDQTGSMIGRALNSTVSNCMALSSVEGEGNLGGLIGYCDSCTVSNSKTLSTVKGYSGIGGLIGATYRSEVIECYSTGSVEGEYEFTGGLIGVCSGKVKRSYSTCTVIGGDLYTGGLTGGNWPCDITDCFTTGEVSGIQYVGGLTGGSSGSITNCYSTGNITGNIDSGGLLGTNTGIVTASYWDIQTSGQTTSAGGEGKTTDEMQSIDTYAGWDFATTPIWVINGYLNSGYPYFNWDERFHFAGGIGTPDNPFLVSNASELNNVRNGLEANYKQINDIDLSEFSNWEQIGYLLSETDYKMFNGAFDGSGFSITNLNINKSHIKCLGLFGYVYNSTLRNLKIIDASVIGDSEFTGILAGIAFVSNIDSCFASGSVYGGNNTGGLIGSVYATRVTNCTAITDIFNSEDYAGGLLGSNCSNSLVYLCSSSGNVRGSGVVGGLVGLNTDKSKTEESLSNSSVYCSTHSAGGMIGIIDGGGIVNRSYSTGNVEGAPVNMFLGGFIGFAGDSCEVADCYSRGNVVAGYTVCGGFIGYNSANINNCYSTGSVSGSSMVGGFAGEVNAGTITGSYWDYEAAGQTISAGGEGRTTDDMTYQFGANTYTGWDFDSVWVGSYNNNDAYPHLSWQGLTGIEEESNVPKATALHQNYPNPFNPLTEIMYDLNKESNVSLSVFNANGQLVKELVNEIKPAGYHKVSFDAVGLNSGLYFYRLNYDDNTMTKKMILVK